jgi:hypothetical protein
MNEPSGNWKAYKCISFTQPTGAGWYVTHIWHYTPGTNNSRQNLYVSTYNYTEWPNGGGVSDELHTPVPNIPVIFWASGEVGFDPAPATNSVLRTWADKPANEPGCNFPIWQGQHCRVAVYDGKPSAIVSGITTDLPDEGDDVTLGHHSWAVHFTYINTGVVEPPPPPPVVTTPTIEQIRERAWNLLYLAPIAYNAESALARAARAQALGAPVTREFDLGDTRAQGYALGVTYCKIGDWGNVKGLTW